MKSKIKLMPLMFAMAFATLCTAQSPLAGEWTGTLHAGATDVHLAWHVVAGKDGSLTSTIDNIDEGILVMPVKSTSLTDSKVVQEVDTTIDMNGQSIHVAGRFDGTMDKDGMTIKGVLKQTAPEQPPMDVEWKRVPATAAAMPAEAQIAQPQKVQTRIVGDWQGVLHGDGNELHVALHVKLASDGSLVVTADNPDQGQMGVKANPATFTDPKLSATFDEYHGIYDGVLSEDGNTIKGAFTQDQPVELNFTRVLAPAAATPVATTMP